MKKCQLFCIYLHCLILNTLVMEYRPDLSIKENAQLNGVTESAVRKYLMVHKIDRRFDEKLKRFNAVKALQRSHPDWSARAISRETGISPSTVCNYMELDELMKSEGKVSMNEKLDCLKFDSNTPIDFMKYEHYEGSTVNLVAFSNGAFKYNGHSIAFSNMQSYPITFMGERFESTETAYIACNYGLNNTDCIQIQKEIQASTNSLLCKRQYRNNEVDKKYGRKDFFETEWHFNLMLYLVWLKCKQHPEFCEMLAAIPDNYVIIENQNPFKKVKKGNWGCKNSAALKAYNAKVKQLKATGMKGVIKIKEAATIATWNVGVWEGCNHQGKILMACRTALRTGTVPCIRYDLINKAKVYLFGKLLHFEKLDAIPISEQQANGQFVDKHITAIPNELKWVADQDVTRLRSFLLDNPDMPYITCGMGGAFSACVYSSLLYGTYKGLGRAVTCYNLNSISDETLLKCKVLINTAAGRNDDVVQVAERLLKLKHPNAANFTPFDNENNKVKKIISKLNPESSINLDGDNMVMGKGAFVNINEAISSFSLYYKAITGKTDFLDLDFNKNYTYTSNAGKTKLPPLGQIKHFVVLYGSYGEPVAYDFESKIVESGFASVQLADYRNFTHGRFSFVGNNICTAQTVKKCGETAVVMLVTPREKKTVEYYRQIAENNKFKFSNQVLPDWTPIITLETEYDSPLASIDLLFQLTKLYLDISHSRETEDVEKPVCSNIDKRTPRGKVRFKKEFKKFGALHSDFSFRETPSITTGHITDSSIEYEGVSEKTRTKAISEFERLLAGTKRKGIDKVIEWARESQFYYAAASHHYHAKFNGGLLCHSLNVCHKAQSINITGKVPSDSIILSALLHDVCKADVYEFIDGRWTRNQENFKKGHGRRSLAILQELGLLLNEEEKIAIRWHDTTDDIDYKGTEKDSEYRKEYELIKNENHPLLDIIHKADRDSSKDEVEAQKAKLFYPVSYINENQTLNRRKKPKPFPFDTSSIKPVNYSCVGIGNICIDAIIRRDCKDGFTGRNNTDTSILQEVGGSVGNVMCNLAHFGWKTYPIARLGQSRAAKQIISDFERFGADTRMISTEEGGDTYIYKAHHYFDANGNPETKYGQIQAHHGRYDSNGVYSKNARLVSVRKSEVQSMLDRIDFVPTVLFFDSGTPGCRETARILKEKGTILYFEPVSTFDKYIGSCVTMSDIIKVSRENFPNIEDFVSDWENKLVIQTLDSEGARFNLCGKGWIMVPPVKNDYVIDPEGAGDMTSSAFINALGRLNALSLRKMTQDIVYTSFLGAKAMWYHDPMGKLLPNGVKDLLPVEISKKTTINNKQLVFNQKRLLGAIIGDIAGSMYELAENNVYSKAEAKLFPVGSSTRIKITDDSVLTIAVARYLLENDTLTLNGLTEMVHRYTQEHPLTFPGGGSMYGTSFRKWIKNPKPYKGDTNGSAMRCSSVGWLCDSVEQVMEVAKFTADISHNSTDGEKGAQAIALCVYLARIGKTKKQIKKSVQKLIGYDLSKNCDTLREETKLYVKKKNHINALCTATVPNAITAFLESTNYEDAIQLAISLGGDSDTIACMCGAIAGAFYKEIPAWLVEKATKKLAKYDDFVEVIKMLDKAEPKHYMIKS